MVITDTILDNPPQPKELSNVPVRFRAVKDALSDLADPYTHHFEEGG